MSFFVLAGERERYNENMQYWVAVSVLLILLAMSGTGLVFFLFAISRRSIALPGKERLDETEADLRSWRNCMDRHRQEHAWLSSQPMEEITIQSDEGLKLYGRYFACEQPHRILLCVHGYRGQAFHDFAGISAWLHANHCDLLLIDQRASGKSEGKHITFGAKEKKDVRAWCEYIDARNPSGLPVYLYGISMGCTTVLLSVSQKLPASVRGIIADCGFTSVKEIFALRARESFHLPPWPLLCFLEGWCILLAGFRFSQTDARKALAASDLPVLFLHGLEDHFVPPENSVRNYQACRGKKHIVLVEGAVHASASSENPMLYQNSLAAFFRNQEGII